MPCDFWIVGHTPGPLLPAKAQGISFPSQQSPAWNLQLQETRQERKDGNFGTVNSLHKCL